MKKILVVEDNELNLKLMKDLLEIHGYSADSAENGKIALEKIQINNYDLILLDIQMPVFTGYDFLEASKDLNRPPIIVVSACAMEQEVKKAKDLGCVDYISKPIKIDEFLNVIKTYAPAE